MLKYKILFKGNYVSIISPLDAPYEALHEKSGVLIVPYLINEECFIIRKEYCPPYCIKEDKMRLYYTLISGGIEDNESVEDSLFRELEEETGVIYPNIEWIEQVSNIPVCKSTDYRTTIFIMGVTDYDYIIPKGDGTANEAKSKSIKVSIDEWRNIIDNKDNYDYLLYGMYYKILDLYKEGRLK